MSSVFPYVMIDADVLVIDKMHREDSRFVSNRELLDRILSEEILAGITTQALFETTGKFSFNTALHEIPTLHEVTLVKYGLFPVPNIDIEKDYSGVTLKETMEYISKKMSLGDAIMAAQIEKYAPDAKALLTWNAKHFDQKICVPVLTPAEWLAAHPATTQS